MCGQDYFEPCEGLLPSFGYVCPCMLFAVIVDVSILFLAAWAYVIFCGAAGFLLSYPGVYVI
jgi:NADH:ubiquinone oxidoreductase subunit 3 (subunit A)